MPGTCAGAARFHAPALSWLHSFLFSLFFSPMDYESVNYSTIMPDYRRGNEECIHSCLHEIFLRSCLTTDLLIELYFYGNSSTCTFFGMALYFLSELQCKIQASGIILIRDRYFRQTCSFVKKIKIPTEEKNLR